MYTNLCNVVRSLSCCQANVINTHTRTHKLISTTHNLDVRYLGSVPDINNEDPVPRKSYVHCSAAFLRVTSRRIARLHFRYNSGGGGGCTVHIVSDS